MTNTTTQSLLQIRRLAFLLFLLFISSNVSAAQISGVCFNENYLDQGINMSLQGTGIKSLLFFKAFAAGFYKGQGDDSDLLGNYPKRIEVQYFVSIPGEKLNNFTIDIMKNNVSPADLGSLKDEIRQMGKYFVDLKAGDRFSLTYIPSVGTEFAHNGKLVGIIKGSKFSKALFSVWIGKKPFDSRLKEQVLGLNHHLVNRKGLT
ncbi:MAG: chalcone isomerase family protein [Candidatus Omnitrophica bacterium]|nr:chalcone isomerase family protein [Candidatus Omnitrophota bacterium]